MPGGMRDASAVYAGSRTGVKLPFAGFPGPRTRGEPSRSLSSNKEIVRSVHVRSLSNLVNHHLSNEYSHAAHLRE